ADRPVRLLRPRKRNTPPPPPRPKPHHYVHCAWTPQTSNRIRSEHIRADQIRSDQIGPDRIRSDPDPILRRSGAVNVVVGFRGAWGTWGAVPERATRALLPVRTHDAR